MPKTQTAHLDIDQIVRRFPGKATMIRRLVMKDEAFREICEDYCAARASLAFFEAVPVLPERPEVAEFRQIVEQLELEIVDTLQRSAP